MSPRGHALLSCRGVRHPNVILAVLCVVAVCRSQQGPTERIVATFAQRCIECHDSAAKKGGIDFETLPHGPKVEWLTALRRALDQVHAGVMPPREAELLTSTERVQLLADGAAVLAAEVPQLVPLPLRVTVRRLSRVEWEYAVFDLFGVVTARADQFPANDLGYGFDNIGDALSFSTLHLESYLAAAADVAGQVFHGEHPESPARQQVEAERMEAVDGAAFDSSGDVANLYANATIATEVELPRDGNYRIAVFAGATQAGDEPARMTVAIDGRELCAIEVRQREPRVETVTIPIGRGRHRIAIAFVNDFWDPQHPDPQLRDRNLMVDWIAVEGPLDLRPRPTQQDWLAPHEHSDWSVLARVIASRVYRHEASPQQAKLLVDVAVRATKNGAPRDEASRQLLTAALLSPRFLFRIEPKSKVGRGTALTIEPVPAPELAVRLSFLLWSSVPDDELAALGRSGKLQEPLTLKRQLERMLRDPRAARLSQNFASQWLELRALDVRTPDPSLFPAFTDTLRASMRRETELLFQAVLAEGLDVRTLLDSDFTYLDAALAHFYGFDGAFGDEFVRVKLEGNARRRRGLLGHASFLLVTSNPTRTSPVKRGKWVLENLLDQAPPPPPPGNAIFASESSVRAPRVLREQLAAHRAREACASCHARMDAFGLALERFDAIGQFRDQVDGDPIDASATLPDGTQLDGEAALRALLVDNPAFPRTMLRKLFVYGVGREATASERLALDLAVDQKAALGVVTIADLLAILVATPAFTHREVLR